MTYTKEQIRKILVNRRRQLSLLEQQQFSRIICNHLTKHELFHNSDNIAGYLAHKGEVATHELIHSIWKQHKLCYLPTLQDQNTLNFIEYNQSTKLSPNKFGIDEPEDAAALSSISPEKLDLVLVPTVAFDNKGNRLGMGAGYYDRTFHFLKDNRTMPFILGLAYDFQFWQNLPSKTWDIPLHGIVTESGVRIF